MIATTAAYNYSCFDDYGDDHAAIMPPFEITEKKLPLRDGTQLTRPDQYNNSNKH